MNDGKDKLVQLILDLERIADKQEKLSAQGDKCTERDSDHEEADFMLLEFIGDPRVTEAFRRIERWYA